MSRQSTLVLVGILVVVGGTLLGLVLALAGVTVWCMTPSGQVIARACNDGSLKEIALALIGAVSALLGAYWLKEKQS